MAVRKIGYNESLETVWEECGYTEARAGADEHANDLVASIAAIVPRTLEVMQGQHTRWHAETRAQAKVDSCDFALDQLVEDFTWVLEKLTRRAHRDPLWTRYLGSDSPWEIRRMGLSAEVERLKGWPALIAKESDSELKGFASRFELLLKAGTDALAGRTAAASARAEYRAFTIQPLIDAVNSARTTLYSQLLGRSVERKLSRAWPDEFFLHISASRARRADPPAEPPAGSTPA